MWTCVCFYKTVRDHVRVRPYKMRPYLFTRGWLYMARQIDVAKSDEVDLQCHQHNDTFLSLLPYITCSIFDSIEIKSRFNVAGTVCSYQP